ncbi:hypothetical protein DFH28DRAFT_925924 [Melampsora americana]|nr:hypothetical protein DFH28DRAFT_925924 [Melampsora americana]
MDYIRNPHLAAHLSERAKRALRRGFLAASTWLPGILPPIDQVLLPRLMNMARRNLGQEALALPVINDQCDVIVSLRCPEGTDYFEFHAESVDICITLSETVAYWRSQTVHPARIIRLEGNLDVQVCKYIHTVKLEKYLSDNQQNYYAAALLSLFKKRIRNHARKITVPEAQQVSTLRFLETHLLLCNNAGIQSAFTLQEKTDMTLLTMTSDSNFLPPAHEGQSTLVDILYAFTHFTYEHHHNTAVLYGFQVSESTIFDSVMVDMEYTWSGQCSTSTRLKYFAEQHKCQSLCRRLDLTEPVAPW